MIIPIQVNNEGVLSLALTSKMEELTLKELKTKEAHLEEFVRDNIGLLFTNNADEETLLVVGQQVVNEQKGRSDLVAVDGDGNLVLIELKRDVPDITAKKEAFEFQAIRYAANLASINSQQELVQKLFTPYVSKHFGEFSGKYLGGLNASEIATREIDGFLEANNQAGKNFNRRQRIVLIASDFDAQTKSACAWLAKNGIEIRCVSLKPMKYSQQHFLSVEQLIPPPALEGFFVKVANEAQAISKQSTSKSQIAKQSLPKMGQLFKWGLIAPGDTIYISTSQSEIAKVKDDKQVVYQGQDMTYNAWGQKITGWSAINIYEWTVDQKTNKTLDILRREKVQEIEQAASDSSASTAEV